MLLFATFASALPSNSSTTAAMTKQTTTIESTTSPSLSPTTAQQLASPTPSSSPATSKKRNLLLGLSIGFSLGVPALLLFCFVWLYATAFASDSLDSWKAIGVGFLRALSTPFMLCYLPYHSRQQRRAINNTTVSRRRHATYICEFWRAALRIALRYEL